VLSDYGGKDLWKVISHKPSNNIRTVGLLQLEPDRKFWRNPKKKQNIWPTVTSHPGYNSWAQRQIQAPITQRILHGRMDSRQFIVHFVLIYTCRNTKTVVTRFRSQSDQNALKAGALTRTPLGQPTALPIPSG